ncbi:LytR C-terminal domain-containing protein [Corynebacterium hindlerae]|uniref:LytR C-terminal domain-containing protein n=1 Tax=Corynebacterium hindlerae TaxID=699041 RepID=UPI0031B69DB7
MSTNETSSKSAGLPIRGIAMIILAVAVALLAWGVYSMTNTGSDDVVVSQETSQQKPAPAPAAPAPGAPTPAAPAPATEAPATPAAPVAPEAGEAGETPKVFALNNSTVQGLANRVADNLKSKGYPDVESGNFPEEILPESVAYYTPGNAAEQRAAEKIAQELQIKAAPRIEALKDKPAGVVVVITEDLNR